MRFIPSLLLGVYSIVMLLLGYETHSMMTAIVASVLFVFMYLSRAADLEKMLVDLVDTKKDLSLLSSSLTELRSAFFLFRERADIDVLHNKIDAVKVSLTMLQDRVTKIDSNDPFGG